MASTPLLGLSLPADGTTNWGTLVNTSITALLDSAVAGTTTLSSDADVTLSATTEATNQARQAIILWTATGTATRNITAPAQSKTYVVINATGGTQSIVFRGTGPTTGVTIPAGKAYMLAWRGTDFVTIGVTSVNLATDVTGVLGVANGGTGQTTYTNGQLLIGNSTGNTLTKANLTAGTGISVTNGTGSILIENTAATATVRGGIELGSNTVQTVSPNTVTAFASRTYALQVNSDGQGVVNVPCDPRTSSITSTSAITPNLSFYDQYAVTAQAVSLTINAPSGSPVDGNKLIFRILDNGTSRTLTWNSTYTAIGVNLPTATTSNKTTYVGCIYNAHNARWDVVAVTTQA